MMDKALAKKYQNGLKLEIIIKGKDDDEMEKTSDLAPEVKDADAPEQDEEMPQGEMKPEADEEMMMLKQMTENAPQGREPMTLGERAKAKMRARMEEKEKFKK